MVGAIEDRGRLPPAIGSGPVAGGVVEVGQLVVEQEAAARHDDAGAAGLLDGQGVGHHVAPAVGGDQVGGRRALLVAGRGRRPVQQPRPVEVARGRRGGQRLASRRSGRRGSRRTAGTAGSGSARRRRPGRPRRRCGRRRPARRRRGSSAGPRLAASDRGRVVQDVERLADGGAATGRRRHAVHVEIAVADVGRLLVEHPVAGRSLRFREPGRHRQGGVGYLRWRATVRTMSVAIGPRYITSAPPRAIAPVGVGEIGVAEHRANGRRRHRRAGRAPRSG